MSSTAGIHGHVGTAAGPRIQWTRVQRALTDQTAVVRSSLAASRAYSEARSDARRRQVLAGFLDSIR
jgi:hypothetical protein